MQGQGSTVNSFLGAFEFDNDSGSRNEQEIYWNNVTNSGNSRHLRDYLLSSSDQTSMTHISGISHNGSGLNDWTLVGSSSSQQALDHAGHDYIKMDDGWSLPLTIHAGVVSQLEERQMEQSNINPLETVSTSLHNCLQNELLGHQHANPNGALHGSSLDYELVGTDIQPLIDSNSGSHQYTASSSVARPMLIGGSSDPGGSSSGTAGNLADDNGGRSGCSMDGRRLSCKRKNMESVAGQSSLNGDSSLLQVRDNIRHILPDRQNGTLSISVSPQHSLNVNSSEQQLNPTLGGDNSGSIPDCHSSLSMRSDIGSSGKSFRMRVNPTYAQEFSGSCVLPSGSSSRNYFWPPHSSSSGRSFPSSRYSGLRPMIASTSSPYDHSTPQLLPGVHQNLLSLRWNRDANLRMGSSSSASVISGEGSSISDEDANLRALSRSVSEDLTFAPPSMTKYYTHDPVTWSSTSGNSPANINSTSLAGSSSAPSGPNAGWIPSQGPLPPLPHRISGVSQSLIPSSGSDPGSESCPFPPSSSVLNASLAEMVRPSAVDIQRLPHDHLRSSFLIDRPGDGIFGPSLSLRNLRAANEGRIRMVSEIQNALDLIRRRESLRFESVFDGRADLHDRHRDMRLDVDNMSYEELLALEECIGNVSTGLCEENIKKCLKKRKYSSAENEMSVEVEPCCVCQEEYVDEEELGVLDCGHDFHSGCIMQWLMRKNLCPICKATALVTATTAATTSS